LRRDEDSERSLSEGTGVFGEIRFVQSHRHACVSVSLPVLSFDHPWFE